MQSLDAFAGEKLAALEANSLRRRLKPTRRHDGAVVERDGKDLIFAERDRGRTRVGDVLKEAPAAGAQVVEVSRRRETLEDLFMRRAL